MSPTNWDKDLAKIDKQLESISDEALFPTKGGSTSAKQANVEKQRSTSTLGVMARLALALVLAVAIVFWPYDARCGLQLAYYLAAVAAVTASGVWSAIWSWRHRSGRAHAISLGLVGWGLVLGAMEVLPRIGYATPTDARPASWTCPAPQ